MQKIIQAMLINEIQNGALGQVVELLEAGDDPNEVGEKGNTALHEACKQGYADIAALLLSKGANYTIHNADGKTPLNPDFTKIETIHRIRQEYQRLSVAPYNNKSSDEEINNHVERLNNDGVVKINGLLTPQQLQQLQNDFEIFIKKVRLKRFLKFTKFNHYDQKEYWQPKHHAYVTNDAILYSDELIKFCISPILTGIANYYLGKPAYIKRAYAMRYHSFKPISINQFAWHHDMEDRQMKVLMLLTDVGQEDQYMEYVKGTHQFFHPYQCFFKNKLDFEYFHNSLNKVEIFKTTGQAGDIFLFDSNGMHRGIRKKGPVRDAFFIEFTAAKNQNNIWGSESKSDLALAAKNDLNSPLNKLMNTTPKWIRTGGQKTRNHPSWIESLQTPELWI